jgi:intracellular sulfur oxidation DsrE/DsrF family protein
MRYYEQYPIVLTNLNIFSRKLPLTRMKLSILLFASLLSAGCILHAQDKKTGPVIPGYGAVWEVPNATYTLETSNTLRAVFDVMDSPEDPTQVNPWIETAARYLNMHARSGVDPERLKVALVVHNKASTDLLDTPEYQNRFGTDNPNRELLKALMDSGAQVIFCGQSSHARQVPIEQTIEGVQLSLSAMTALIQLQDQGYRLIKF